MPRYRVFRSHDYDFRLNLEANDVFKHFYNPYWMTLVSETKTGKDREDWIDLISAWKAWAEDYDWEPYNMLKQSWQRRILRFKPGRIDELARRRKLTVTPIIWGAGKGLARSNKSLFSKVRSELRSRGEGDRCWACAAVPRPGEVALDAHEFWEFDFEHRIRRLTDVRFLCTDCHYLVYSGWCLFLFLPDEDQIRLCELFCRVNNYKLIEAIAHFRAPRPRNFLGSKPWSIDLSILA